MKDESEVTREPTVGERLVGLNFNPGNSAQVAEIKRKAADFLDAINTVMHEANKRTRADDMGCIAIERAIEAQMWAVKAATWRG